MSLRLRLVAPLALLLGLAPACSGTVEIASTGTGSSSSSSAGGEAGSGGGVTGDVGGGGAGGGVAGGGAGGGGAGGGGVAASIEGAPKCGSLEAKLDGVLAGVDLTATFTVSGVALSGGVQIEFGDYGALYFTGDDIETPGVVHAGNALLRVPEDGADPGAFYCGGPGSALLFDGALQPRAVLHSVSRLGPCPGEPVAGEMEICFADGDCPEAITSTVAGASFEVPLDGFIGSSGLIGGTEAKVIATIPGGGGFITLQATSLDPDSNGVQTSTIGLGYVTIPEGLPDAGAVYCVGPGSTLEYSNDPGYANMLGASLKNLSRLGTCPAVPVPGDVGFCLSFD